MNWSLLIGGSARLVAFAGLVVVVSGCGGSTGYHVSGTVTFKGAPVPAGKIYFAPDTSKGNSGAAGFATIVNGKYDTAAPDGQGIVGGPMRVGIEGNDPSAKGDTAKGDTSGEVTVKSLFPLYETPVDLPKGNSTKDFEVPAEAAVRNDQKESGAIAP